MAEHEYVVVYAGTYPAVAAAQSMLDTIEHQRLDHPRSRIIPEWFGGGALTRKELNDAAEELLANEAGLIVVGEATTEPALDKVLAGTEVVKREIAATVDQITSELPEAFKA